MSDLQLRAAIIALKWIVKTPDERPVTDIRTYAIESLHYINTVTDEKLLREMVEHSEALYGEKYESER